MVSLLDWELVDFIQSFDILYDYYASSLYYFLTQHIPINKLNKYMQLSAKYSHDYPAEAKRQGLWNLFLPHQLPTHLTNSQSPSNNSSISPSQYLTNREYGILCETMGRSPLAPEACNCSAPDTGNMEVLLKFGTKQQQRDYLRPLLEGRIRSAFLMTEPDVASSDATNMQTSLVKYVEEGQDGSKRVKYRLNGKKWWSSGAMDPRCQVALVLAKMDYSDPSLKMLEGYEEILKESKGRHRGHTSEYL